MQSDALDRFLNEIIDSKQLPGVTEDVRPTLTADLKERLLDQINSALINALSDEKLEEFNTRLDDPAFDDAAAQQFLVDAGVNVQRVTAETMLRFRDFYLNPAIQEPTQEQ